MTPLIPEMWSRITRQDAIMAAHGAVYTGRHVFEAILASWCRIRPEMRGALADVLIAVWEQTRQQEQQRLEVATYRVQRAVWPLFDMRARRYVIIDAATQSNDGALSADELHAVIAHVCVRATRPHRRASR